MKKTIIIVALMTLIMIIPAFAASSENDEQAFVFESMQSNQQADSQSNINPLIILIIGLFGLLYIKNKD